MTQWTLQDIPPQHGRLAIVTGATGGLGYETSLGLAQAGAEVIVTGRNPGKGKLALEQIRRSVPGAAVRFEMLDLASLASVREFAARMLAQGRPVDVLINNAGVMEYLERRLTAEGFEMQFGTNHLGHFALTAQLLPLLRGVHSARVVTVSSLAHRSGRIEFANLQGEQTYRPWGAYQQSKLANLLFAFELQRQSDAHGWGLISNAAHPGFARTDLIRNGPGNRGPRGIIGRLIQPFASQPAAAGALPTLFAATSPDAVPMGYYGPNGFYELKGSVARAYVAPMAQDEALARQLWTVSEKLTGVTWPAEQPALRR